nr:hypothetical protein [Candidatus Sigynarchaeota archaeon]
MASARASSSACPAAHQAFAQHHILVGSEPFSLPLLFFGGRARDGGPGGAAGWRAGQREIVAVKRRGEGVGQP